MTSLFVTKRILFPLFLFFTHFVAGTSQSSQQTPFLPASLQRIKECLNKSVKVSGSGSGNSNTFTMLYDDSFVEIFNILNKKEIKQIVALSKCVQLEHSSLFQNRDQEISKDLAYEGSNITYLTGLVQTLLPNVTTKLHDAAKLAVSEAKWKIPIQNLGIRTIQFLSYQSDKRKKTKAELDELRLEKMKESQNMFVISPPKSEVEIDAERLKLGLNPLSFNHDEHISKYLMANDDSIYTMILTLSSRNIFTGGSILVRKSNRNLLDTFISNDPLSQKREIEDDDEDEYDEESSKLKIDSLREQSHNNLKERYKGHMLTTSIARNTPDEGGAIFLLSNQEHGIEPVTEGLRQSLVIEFWKFRDVPPGEMRPSVNEGADYNIDKNEL